MHIADVAHYVPEGGALDVEAYERGTSVYFPDRAVHMFPSELSTGLCSLNPHVDRLVQSCVMDIDKRGTVMRYELHDGVIHSDARMTYTDVSAILTDRDPEVTARYQPLVPMFETMRELFEILNSAGGAAGRSTSTSRNRRSSSTTRAWSRTIIAAERKIAHRIIEEFMLVANETVAQHLDDQHTPTLYRVHEEPDPIKVAQFEEFISTLGYSLDRAAERREAARLPEAGRTHARHARGEADRVPHAADDAEGALRPFEPGALRPGGDSYTHFTSPIRRYPDLIVHRTLRETRHGLHDRGSRAPS